MTDKPTIQQRAAPLLAILSAKKPQGLLPETRDIMALLREALAEIERLKLLALDQWAQKTTVTQPVTGNAFTGRQTGRNRADIPTDAGVPRREAELREIYEQECGGTISYDESRIDTIATNGNTGEHYT